MTIDEAIEMLDDYNPEEEYRDYSKFWPALKLGIEALKFRLRWEQQEGEDEFPLLPGETEEYKNEPLLK